MRARASLMWTGLLLSGVLLMAAPAHAAVSARVRAAQTAFVKAQAKADQAGQDWEKARQDLASAQAAHLASSNQLHQARQAAAQKHAREVGMSAAITERETLSRQASARRKALAAALKSGAGYQAAEREAEEARQRLGDLPDDKSLTDEQREKLGSDLARKIRRPSELTKAAEADDSELKHITERLQSVQKKIVELQPEMKKAIDTDPLVVQAADKDKKTAAAIEKAREAVARAEQDANTAQASLGQQQQQLQAALAQARRGRR